VRIYIFWRQAVCRESLVFGATAIVVSRFQR